MKENYKIILCGAGLFIAGVVVGMILFTQVYLISSYVSANRYYDCRGYGRRYAQSVPAPYEDNSSYSVIPINSPAKYQQDDNFSTQSNIGAGSGSTIQFIGNPKQY